MPLDVILPIILFLIVLAMAFIAGNIRAHEDKKFSLKSALHLDNSKEQENRNITMSVVAIGIGLAIMLTLAWGGVIGRDEPSLAAFVPIWLVVFIPLLGRPKKKNKKGEPGHLILLISLVASITVLATIGMLLFWFAA